MCPDLRPTALGAATVAALLLIAPTSALAGAVACGPFTTDLVAAYLDASDPGVRQTQDPDSGWTFHRANPSGVLLQGIYTPGSYTAGYWGSIGLPFSIPTGGPIYSENPALNQVVFFRRTPSFTGLFLHPGEADGFEACASLNIQAPVFITAISGQFEKLGFFDGATCRVVKRVSGVDTEIVAPTFAGPAPAAAVALTPMSGSLPFALNPGDKLWVQTQRFGNANEDWCNVSLSVTFDGGPLVPAPASVTTACLGRSTNLRVNALGSALSYRWRRNGVNISDIPGRFAGTGTSQLTISAITKADTADRYDCTVTSACTGFSVISGEGRVTFVLPDFNADGTINTPDLAIFLGKFGQTVPTTEPTDLNSDGIVNTADLTTFLGAFGSACP